MTRSTSTVGFPLLSTIWRALIDLTADSREAMAAAGGGWVTAEPRIARRRTDLGRREAEEREGLGKERAAEFRRRLDWARAMSMGRVLVSDEAEGVERGWTYIGTFVSRSVRQWQIEPGGVGNGRGSAPRPVSLTIRNSRASAVHRHRTHRSEVGPTM